jgi:two-component system chemotaxis response regulator CheY
MKVLVVDDSATMRRIVINSLQRSGVLDVVEAGDGGEALSRFDATIDVVIVDWNMPGMTGVEFTRALRLRDDGTAVPVVMILARSVEHDAEAAFDAGISATIVKPFTPKQLEDTLAALRFARAA